MSALVIEDVEDAGKSICVRARTRGGAVACPGCGTETGRVHGSHERAAADVPVNGRQASARRPFCRLAKEAASGSCRQAAALSQ